MCRYMPALLGAPDARLSRVIEKNATTRPNHKSRVN